MGQLLSQQEDSGVGAPAISLILCTVGRTQSLARLLDSLLSQTSDDFEVIVVDQNASQILDEPLAAARGKLKITHLRAQPGLSRARNLGLAHAHGRLLCFPDDDCWYAPGLIAEVVRRFAQNPDIDLLMGRTVDEAGKNSLGSYMKQTCRIDRYNVWFAGNSNTIFLRADLARRIGPFREELGVGATTPFQSGEETDYVLRGLRLGASAWFQDDLVVYHAQVTGLGGEQDLSRARRYAPGFGRVLRLHYGVGYVSWRLARTLLRAAISLAKCDFPAARYNLEWVRGTINGFLAPIASAVEEPPRRK